MNLNCNSEGCTIGILILLIIYCLNKTKCKQTHPHKWALKMRWRDLTFTLKSFMLILQRFFSFVVSHSSHNNQQIATDHLGQITATNLWSLNINFLKYTCMTGVPKFSGSVNGKWSSVSLSLKCFSPLMHSEVLFNVFSSPSSNTTVYELESVIFTRMPAISWPSGTFTFTSAPT